MKKKNRWIIIGVIFLAVALPVSAYLFVNGYFDVRNKAADDDIATVKKVKRYGSGEDGDITVSANTDINATNLITGRNCVDGGDAVNYSVSSLTSNTATLVRTPSTGCLSEGDEVLLINQGGNASSSINLGNYETFIVKGTSGAVVTFTEDKKKFYGEAIDGDTNIGISYSGNQRVMLQRVTH